MASKALRLKLFLEAQTEAQRLGVSLQLDLRQGTAYTEILESAATLETDLLVIGSRNDRRIGRAMIGGVAQKIIGLSDKPVLALNLT